MFVIFIRGILITMLILGIWVPNAIGGDCFIVSKECASNTDKCDEDEKELKDKCGKYPDLCDSKKSRFTDYQPNYGIYQFTEDDEGSIEAHYSFKYNLTRPNCMPVGRAADGECYPDIKCLKEYWKRWEFFFSYTGEFDFYVGTRDSGPVINRISNPAFHWRKHFYNSESDLNFSFEWINISAEHRSDGQTTEADEIISDPGSSNFGRYRAQVEFEDGNHEYFDSISRGANYLSVETKLNIGEGHNDFEKNSEDLFCVTIWLSAKLYLSEDSKIYWGPLANKGLKIYDYDRVKLIISRPFRTGFESIPRLEIGYEYTIGDELFDTDSHNFNLFFPLFVGDNFKIPFYVRAHIGPMSTLSDYTKEQNSIGFGVKFR
jgi:hypothetical protein